VAAAWGPCTGAREQRSAAARLQRLATVTVVRKLRVKQPFAAWPAAKASAESAKIDLKFVISVCSGGHSVTLQPLHRNHSRLLPRLPLPLTVDTELCVSLSSVCH
jgi:hypothetical protein